jgi:hypothetical protein
MPLSLRIPSLSRDRRPRYTKVRLPDGSRMLLPEIDGRLNRHLWTSPAAREGVRGHNLQCESHGLSQILGRVIGNVPIEPTPGWRREIVIRPSDSCPGDELE